MKKRIRYLVYEALEKGAYEDIVSKIVDIFLIFLISLNVVCVFVETCNINDQIKNILNKLELFSIIIFTIEYFLRLWASPEIYPELKAGKARIKYAFTFLAIIDLLSILPFYLPFVANMDLRILRALRLFRLLNIIKFNRYSSSMKIISKVLLAKAIDLLSSIFIISILILVTSVLMYYIEHEHQPEVFTNAFSGLWWAIVTFTTVGYGDAYPVTVIGKILGGIVSIFGIGLIAVPTGIISSGFMEYKNVKNDEKVNKTKKEKTDLQIEFENLKLQMEKIEKLL